MSGLPPYGPGDLIDVDFQGDRVTVTMADYFGRPLRLSRSEALALYLRGTALLAMPTSPRHRRCDPLSRSSPKAWDPRRSVTCRS